MVRLDNSSFALATRILDGANELALATLRADGSPHITTVNFASDGLIIYLATAIDSQKAHGMGLDGRVSLALNLPNTHWKNVQGLSIDGDAEILRDVAELALASALLLTKVPAYKVLITEPRTQPWPGMLFIKIRPRLLTLLDYTRGFGFSRTFQAQVPAEAL